MPPHADAATLSQEQREIIAQAAGAKRSYQISAVEVCLQALRHGPLIRCGRCNPTHWRFGRRLFSHQTVNALIARGLAVREGDVIREVK